MKSISNRGVSMLKYKLSKIFKKRQDLYNILTPS